ncbi:MAG: CHASE2 domain-containing protein, partial [Prochlorotrichaceae cyanobacterium]
MQVGKQGKTQWLHFWNQAWTRFKALPNELITGSVVFLGLTVGLITVGLNSIGAWQTLEWQGYRLLFAARQAEWLGNLLPSREWDDRLVVIAIDDQSLRTYGQFATWKRDRYTELLNTLQASPPAAVGFALLFPEETPEDAPFAEAMAFNGTIVLGIARDNQGNTLFPRPFLNSIAALGHVQSLGDSDGITRSSWLYIPTSTDAVPSLSVSLAQVYNQSLAIIDPDAPPIPIPEPQATLEQNTVWINWPAPSREVPQYSFAAVLNHQVDPSAFADKIVLVGLSATGLESNPLRTPFDADANGAGVYLYTAILDNLLNDRFLHRPNSLWVGSGLVLLSLAGAFLLHRFSLRFQLLTLVTFPVLWIGIALVVFHAHWWIPVTSPIAALWLVGIMLQLRAH